MLLQADICDSNSFYQTCNSNFSVCSTGDGLEVVLCDLLTWEVKLARHSFSRTRICRVEVSTPGSKRGECVFGDEDTVQILYRVKITKLSYA